MAAKIKGEEQTSEMEELDMEKEEDKAVVRKYEDDILGGLLAAAGYSNSEEEIHPVEIVRKDADGNKVVLFTFRIHPLSEEDFNKCSKRHTKYVRNKQFGVRIPENTDRVAYRADCIYTATVKEDRERLWDNKEAWKRLDVMSGIELIDKVLKAGEKDMICDKIDEISGYNYLQEETAKN